MNIKAVIIDDELAYREMISGLLKEYFPQTAVVAVAASVDDGVIAIEKHHPDILFLDIEIIGGSGFDVLKRLSSRDFRLIFITAFNEFAIQAIRFSAIDYLLKPVNENDFKSAVDRALADINQQTSIPELENLFAAWFQKEHKRIALRTQHEIHLVEVADIIRCEADNAYTTFYIATGEVVVVSKGIGEYVDMLTPFGFVVPHQSHLVNLSFIKKLDKSDGGFLVLRDKTQVPVSVRRKQQLIDLLSRL